MIKAYRCRPGATRNMSAFRNTCRVPVWVKGCPHQPALTSSIRVCCTSDSRHASGGRAELRSVPLAAVSRCSELVRPMADQRVKQKRRGDTLHPAHDAPLEMPDRSRVEPLHVRAAGARAGAARDDRPACGRGAKASAGEDTGGIVPGSDRPVVQTHAVV